MMKKEKELNLRKDGLSLILSASFGLFLVALGYIVVPEVTSEAFADGTVNGNAVTLQVNPINPEKNNTIRVQRKPVVNGTPDNGDFYTIGYGVNVKTANEYGYQLYIRSATKDGRIPYADSEFANSAYIASIASDISVDLSNNASFNAVNSYGWSTDWNPITQKGVFHGLDNSNKILQKTINPTPDEGDNLDLYFGVNINNSLMLGQYSGKIILTAISNGESDVYDTYYLKYDTNAPNGAVSNMPSDTDQLKETGTPGGVTFTLDIENIPSRNADDNSSFTFLGWSRNKRATGPEFAWSGSAYSPATIDVTNETTTLYAVWGQNFTININTDGGSGIPSTVSCSAVQAYTCDIVLPSGSPSKSGYTFLYWYDTYYGRAYNPGDTVTISFDHPTLDLKAIYSQNPPVFASGNPSTSGDGTGEHADPHGEDTLKDLSDAILNVIRLIKLLPSAESVTLDDASIIEETRLAYEALSDEDKSLINSALTSKYNSVLAAYYSLLESEKGNGNLIVAACAGAAVSTIALTALLIIKKSDDDDEEDS